MLKPLVMKVLILGCGYTGSRLARLLLEQEIPVCLTTRSGGPTSIHAPCFAFSDDCPLLPDQALAGVTHVLHSIPPDAQGIDPVAVYLLPALEKADLQWFGYLSTTGVYGDVQGAWVDEQTPTHPQQYRSEHRVAAEQKFLHAALPTHIFRLPGIYGPGRSVMDRLKAGKAQRIARPGHVFSRIHVEDIVGTLWASMNRPNPPSIYNVADDEPTEPENLLVEASKLLGITPPEAVPFEQAALSPMATTFWSECRRVSNQKIKTELGVVLKYPTYREGLKAILLESQA
jgi:nucleoside-diphosphate-sugar epimerase